MTLLDAIRALQADPSQWMRPLTWRGIGAGITLSRQTPGALIQVPSGGAEIAVFLTVPLALGAWEVLDPRVILHESGEIMVT